MLNLLAQLALAAAEPGRVPLPDPGAGDWPTWLALHRQPSPA